MGKNYRIEMSHKSLKVHLHDVGEGVRIRLVEFRGDLF